MRLFFSGYVFEFAGVKDLTAFDTLDEFGVLFAGHDLYTRVLTRFLMLSIRGSRRRRGWSHNPDQNPLARAKGVLLRRKLTGILDLYVSLSSPIIWVRGAVLVVSRDP